MCLSLHVIEKTGIDTERNLIDILDKIHELSFEHVDKTHMFTLSQVYEGLLLRMGEKNNVTKKQPLIMGHFDEFFKMLPERTESERSWRVPIEEIEAKNYDIKAVNPNRKTNEDNRTPEDIMNIIESHNKNIIDIISHLKSKGL